VRAFAAALRWDVLVQARNGFYWATGFLVLVVAGLLLALPASARANAAASVPALLVVNLPITTFFFAAGLMLLEREEGTLLALALSPLSAGGYLAARIATLTALAAVETLAVVWLAFGTAGSWLPILAGTAALGVIYTSVGVLMASRYASVNSLLLPASLVVSLLLLPLLSHFDLAPRAMFLLHPVEPALTLLRAGYVPQEARDVAFGVAGSACWCAIAWSAARRSLGRLMRDTRATGGR
jgi:fluoroquinolone transport system permease protein